MKKNIFSQFSFVFISLCFATLLIFILIFLLGENPFHVTGLFFQSSVFDLRSWGYALAYATPLIFTALAVVIPFQAGLFNIGGEGQMNLGAIFLISGGLSLPDLGFISLPVAFLCASVGGAIWGAIAGYLKSFRNTHEVFATILLNFISYGILSLCVNKWWKNQTSTAPETFSLPKSYLLESFTWLGGAPVSFLFLAAALSCVIVHFIFSNSKWGFQVRLFGASPETAIRVGIPTKRRVIETMILAGAFAGLACTTSLLVTDGKLRESFSAGLGFSGIAVAFVAAQRPLLVIFAAIFFGFLHHSSLNLELDTEHITRDLSLVIQAICILLFSLQNIRKST